MPVEKAIKQLTRMKDWKESKQSKEHYMISEIEALNLAIDSLKLIQELKWEHILLINIEYKKEKRDNEVIYSNLDRS